MKKIIICILPILLASCFGPDKAEIQKAKDEIFNSGTTTVTQSGSESFGSTTPVEGQKSYYKVNYLTTDKSIDLETVSDIENITDKLDIKGIVKNTQIDKIKVIFENKTSVFPTDNYELKTYKKGSESFLYRAYKTYSVLDLGLNEYTFEGYIGETLISSVKLELFIADPTKITTNKTEEKILNSTGIVNTFSGDILKNLPIDEETYGISTINEDEQTFTYSNLSDFQGTKNDELTNVNCTNFGDYLKNNYTWYYWNTCRPISDENNFSVNVLSLTGDEYRYERHYVSAKLGIYGKILLESGAGVMQSDLQIKNDELKTKTFENTTNSDKLFKDLLK